MVEFSNKALEVTEWRTKQSDGHQCKTNGLLIETKYEQLFFAQNSYVVSYSELCSYGV